MHEYDFLIDNCFHSREDSQVYNQHFSRVKIVVTGLIENWTLRSWSLLTMYAKFVLDFCYHVLHCCGHCFLGVDATFLKTSIFAC